MVSEYLLVAASPPLNPLPGTSPSLTHCLCFQIEVELIFHLNPNLAPSEPQSVIPSKLSRVSSSPAAPDSSPARQECLRRRCDSVAEAQLVSVCVW